MSALSILWHSLRGTGWKSQVPAPVPEPSWMHASQADWPRCRSGVALPWVFGFSKWMTSSCWSSHTAKYSLSSTYTKQLHSLKMWKICNLCKTTLFTCPRVKFWTYIITSEFFMFKDVRESMWRSVEQETVLRGQESTRHWWARSPSAFCPRDAGSPSSITGVTKTISTRLKKSH